MIKGKFTPSLGYILILPLEEESTISFVKHSQDPPKRGKVIAVGGDYLTEFGAHIKAPVKVGDTIIHQTIGYEEIEIDHKKYRIVPFLKVIGVWSDEEQSELN